MVKLTEGSSRPSAAMTSAGSTNRGVRTKLQVLFVRRSCVGIEQSGFTRAKLPRASCRILLKSNPGKGPAIPSPPGTRKAAKPPLVCGFVATKRPNRVGERAGNAQGAEPRLPLKRGASGARRRSTTEQRSCSCVPLGCGVHTHQAALNKSKIKKERRRT
jgi:hypothetical protein